MLDTEIYQYDDSPSIEMDDEHIGQQVVLPQNNQIKEMLMDLWLVRKNLILY